MMVDKTDFVWTGERDRPLGLYRPCRCNVCSRNRKGVGYLSFSDASGHGFTVWITDEKVFQRLRRTVSLITKGAIGA